MKLRIILAINKKIEMNIILVTNFIIEITGGLSINVYYEFIAKLRSIEFIII